MQTNESLLSVTIDTGLLIKLIDNKPGAKDVLKILQWHKEGIIEVYISNRVFEHDTSKMELSQIERLRKIVTDYKISIDGAVFRLNFSTLDGNDLLNGGSSVRSPKEMAQFNSLVGPAPTELPPSSIGKKLSNKLGDYDSLHHHYAAKRDVFLTLDTRDYLATNKRERYKQKLNLIILSPSEFIARHHEFDA